MKIIKPTPSKTLFTKLTLLVALICGPLSFYSQSAIAALSDFQDRLDRVTGQQTNLSQDSRLAELMDVIYDYQLNEYPEFGTYLGSASQDHRWTDMSTDAIEQRKNDSILLLEALETIDVVALGANANLDYKLLYKDLSSYVEAQRYPDDLMPLNQMGGIQQDVARMISMMPARNERQYKNIIARLETADTLIEQNITILKQGLGRGITPPAITLRDVPQQVRNQLFDDPMQSPLLASFKRFPDAMDSSKQVELKAAAIAAYQDKIAPAYRKLLIFLEQEYLPNAVQKVGLSNLPEGRQWYAHKVQRSTTTDFSPQQIHQLGLSEVKRIRRAMDEILPAQDLRGTFISSPSFCARTRSFISPVRETCCGSIAILPKKLMPSCRHYLVSCPGCPMGSRLFPRMLRNLKPLPTTVQALSRSDVRASFLPTPMRYTLGRPGKWRL